VEIVLYSKCVLRVLSSSFSSREAILMIFLLEGCVKVVPNAGTPDCIRVT
jgi:hypothetical protein